MNFDGWMMSNCARPIETEENSKGGINIASAHLHHFIGVEGAAEAGLRICHNRCVPIPSDLALRRFDLVRPTKRLQCIYAALYSDQ